MDLIEKHGISSLAAPTLADRDKLAALTRDERIALINQEIEKGRADIQAGNFTEFESEDEIRAFFEERRAQYETPAI